MRKTLLITSILALLLMGSKPFPGKLVRLTVVNKSGLPVEIKMTGKYEEAFYYLRVPEGDRDFPVEKIFTIIPDTYQTQLYYIELWDPVYGYSCASKSQSMELYRNTRVVVKECDQVPSCPGEPSMIKYGAVVGRRPKLGR